jgi:hypothetical protein
MLSPLAETEDVVPRVWLGPGAPMMNLAKNDPSPSKHRRIYLPQLPIQATGWGAHRKRQDRWLGSHIGLWHITFTVPPPASLSLVALLRPPSAEPSEWFNHDLSRHSACHSEDTPYWGRWGYDFFLCSESL